MLKSGITLSLSAPSPLSVKHLCTVDVQRASGSFGANTCFNESFNQVIVHILFLLVNLRVDNNDGDANLLQSNTYL